MRKVAIITAAGYKGTATEFPDVPHLCPEPLLPIGKEYGNTILERLAQQFNHLGFEVFTTVAGPKYLYSWRPTWNAEHFKFKHDPASTMEPPWTKDRIEEVGRYSTPIVVPDPDKTNYHDSAFMVLDEIGYKWGQCVVAQGDHLFTDGLLKSVVALPFPCQLRPSIGGRAFSILSLTPDAAREYRRLGDSYRAACEHAWNGSKFNETGVAKGAEFARVAPIVYITDILPSHDQYEFSNDVDSPSGYRAALTWLARWGTK